jgi:hypothetical protein
MDPVSPTSTTLPPGDVFAALGASSADDRDAATRMAIGLGAEMGPRLLRWDDASPPSNRARRLWAFMGIHLRRGEDAVREPRNFDLEFTGPLRILLDQLAERQGVLVARELPAVVDHPVSIALRGTTLLGALDAACAQVGCRGGQRARGELVVYEDALPNYPAAYTGPLRVRLVELRSTRSTNFQTTTATLQAQLRIEWEWPVAPVTPLVIRIHGDDRRYEATSVSSVVHAGMVAEPEIELPNVSPIAAAGTVAAMFEGPYDELRLPVGDEATVHGLHLHAVETSDGNVQIVIETVDPARLAGTVELGLSPMVLALTVDGEEGIPQLHRMRVATSAPGSERWGLKFRDGFGRVAELRLRVAAPPVKGKFAFALPPVALP